MYLSKCEKVCSPCNAKTSLQINPSRVSLVFILNPQVANAKEQDANRTIYARPQQEDRFPSY